MEDCLLAVAELLVDLGAAQVRGREIYAVIVRAV